MWISFDEVIMPFSSSLDALQNSHKQENMNNTPTQRGISIVCKKIYIFVESVYFILSK